MNVASIAMKKFREKLHETGNETLLEEYRVKERQSSKKYRQTQLADPELANQYRLKEAARKRVSRALQHSPAKQGRKKNDELEAAVKNFFELESVSRQMPGKNDFVSVLNEEGTKEKLQKRVMLMTVAEASHEFSAKHPQFQSRKSTFYSLRPKHIVNTLTPYTIHHIHARSSIDFP